MIEGGQSTWTHPYDSPAFLNTLLKEHPANPTSLAAFLAHQKAEVENEKPKEQPRKESKGWLAKTLDKVAGGSGEGHDYEEQRAIKVNTFLFTENRNGYTALIHQDAEENFIKRRDALNNGDINAIGTSKYSPAIPWLCIDYKPERKYAADPFAFSAPSEPFNRYASSDITYAFGRSSFAPALWTRAEKDTGYRGSYQRKYNPSLGYDRIAKPPASMLDTAKNSWLRKSSSTQRRWIYLLTRVEGAGIAVPGHTVKTGYGYSG